MMQEVYQELLDKWEKYSKTITKLKQYMGKITKEYDKNVELLLQKLEKQVIFYYECKYNFLIEERKLFQRDHV